MRVYKPTMKLPSEGKSIFLGGTIDMGSSIDWQTKFTNEMKDTNFNILNPRRDDWDSSWKLDPTPGTQFYEQVKWELDAQEASTFIVYNILGNSKSPITLMELGLFKDKKPFVICPKDFYRYGNVRMVCDYYGLYYASNMNEVITVIKSLE